MRWDLPTNHEQKGVGAASSDDLPKSGAGRSCPFRSLSLPATQNVNFVGSPHVVPYLIEKITNP